MIFPAIIDALDQVLNSKLSAERMVKRTLRSQKLDNQGRIWVGRIIYGTLLLQRRIQYLCQCKFPWYIELDCKSKLIVMAAMYDMLEQPKYFEKVVEMSGWKEFVFDTLGKSNFDMLSAEFVVEWPSNELELVCSKYSYPNWLGEMIIDSRPTFEDAIKLAESFNSPGPITLRVNSSMQSRTELQRKLDFDTIPTKYSKVGLTAVMKPEINNNQFYKNGCFEVQDEGSQLIAIATEATSGIVVDYCCGRGGKALHLLDMMQHGTLILHDVDERVLKQAQRRIHKVGIKPNVHVEYVCKSGESLLYGGRGGDTSQTRIDNDTITSIKSGELDCDADIVLVDAPCSSLGTLRRGPNVRWETKQEDVHIYPQLQRKILLDAQKLVKQGGTLVYATCTFNKSECKEVKDWFEKEFTEFEPAKLGFSNECSIQLMPHLHGTDAFFICKWKRIIKGR